MSSSFANNLAHNGTAPASIVVVAKSPRAGTSKTRLVPALGEQGAADLAKAMLLDVLSTIAECEELNAVEKVLYYAPNDEESRLTLVKILRQHNLERRWLMRPVQVRNHDLQSSQLSHILQDALRMQQSHTSGPVVFLGMDAPEIPLRELVAACFNTDHNRGLLCPASDGGYCLLSVPASADSLTAFAGVQWSHPLTAISQLKALSDQGVHMAIGPIMHDVDDDDDLQALCQRLLLQYQQSQQQPRRSPQIPTTVAFGGVGTTPALALARPSLAARSVRMMGETPPNKTETHFGVDEIRQDDSNNNQHDLPILSIATTLYETLTLSPPSSSSSKNSSASRKQQQQQGRKRRHRRPCPFTRQYLVSISRLPPSMADANEEEEDPTPDIFTCGSMSPSGEGDLFHDLRAVWSRGSSPS